MVRCCTDVGDPRPAVASNGRDFYVTWVSANYDVRGIAYRRKARWWGVLAHFA